MATAQSIKITRQLLTQLFSNINISTTHFYKGDACWIWPTTSRYGKIYLRQPIGCTWGAHRLFCELFVDHIPDGHQTDHLCKNTQCVNPVHLEVVTPIENVHRSDSIAGQSFRKTTCSKGHPLSGNNVYRGTRRGLPIRTCRICKREWTAKKRQEQYQTEGRVPRTRDKNRSHCPAGHELVGDTLVVTARGHKVCRICRRNKYSPKAKIPRTHCNHGHLWTESNTLHTTHNGRPRTRCKQCAQQSKSKYREKQRLSKSPPHLSKTPPL